MARVTARIIRAWGGPRSRPWGGARESPARRSGPRGFQAAREPGPHRRVWLSPGVPASVGAPPGRGRRARKCALGLQWAPGQPLAMDRK